MNLFDELAGDCLVRNVRIRFRGHVEWSVFVDGHVRAEVSDELSRELALLRYGRGQFTSVALDVLKGKA